MGFSFGRGRRSSAVAVHPQRSRNPQEEADVESGLGKIQMGRKTTVNKIDDLLGASLSDEGLEQQQAARYREALAGKGGTQRLAPPPPLPQLQPADKTPSRGSTAFFYLRDMLQDAYEYHGVSNLGIFICTFILATCCLYSHWDQRYAMFRSQVQQSFVSIGDPWNSTSLPNDVDDMYDVVQYMRQYTQSLLSSSEDKGNPYNDVRLLDYVLVRQLRLVVNIDTPCRSAYASVLPCYRDDAAAALARGEPPPTLSAAWLPIPAEAYPLYAYSAYKKPMYQVTILSSDGAEPGGASYEGAAERLGNVTEEDVLFIKKYAMDVHLELVAQTQLDNGGDNSLYSIFWLRATRQVSLFALPHGGPLDVKVNVGTTTLGLRTSIASSTSDWIIHVLTAAVFVANAFYMLHEMYEVQACYYQYKFEDITYTKWRAVKHYLSNFWNVIDVVSTTVSLAWSAAWYGLLVLHMSLGVHRFATTWEYGTGYGAGLSFAATYSTFLYAGILNIVLLAIRVYQYMQVHAGLRVYYNLFREVFRCIKDFMFWFLFVLFALAFVITAVFQSTGGNPSFVYRLDGIASMALLTFNFYDYQSFISNRLGLGDWQALVVFLFWMTVILLIVVAQNIVLAITANAYTAAKDEEGPVEATMLRIVLMRIGWYAWYAWKVWLVEWRLGLPLAGGVPLSEAMDRWSEYVVASFADPSGRHKKDLTARLFTRWAVALIPEVRTLLAYYSDAGTLKLYSAPVWADPRITHMHRLLMQYKGRRQWSSAQEYPSYVDMLLRGTAGIVQYLESGLDSRVLEDQNTEATAELRRHALAKQQQFASQLASYYYCQAFGQALPTTPPVDPDAHTEAGVLQQATNTQLLKATATLELHHQHPKQLNPQPQDQPTAAPDYYACPYNAVVKPVPCATACHSRSASPLRPLTEANPRSSDEDTSEARAGSSSAVSLSNSMGVVASTTASPAALPFKVHAMVRIRGVFGGTHYTWRGMDKLQSAAKLMLLVYGNCIGEDDFYCHPVVQAPRAEGAPMAAVTVNLPNVAGGAHPDQMLYGSSSKAAAMGLPVQLPPLQPSLLGPGVGGRVSGGAGLYGTAAVGPHAGHLGAAVQGLARAKTGWLRRAQVTR